MLIIILSYILGAIPAGYLINKYFPITEYLSSSRSPLPSSAKKFLSLHGEQTLSIAADLFKGFITVLIVAYIGGSLSGGLRILVFPFVSPGLIHVGALVFAVLGHVFSVYVCGWGGRGVATAFGGFLFLMPKAALAAMLVFLIAAFFKKSIQFASLIASWSLPVLIWYFYRMNVPYQIAAVFLAILSLITHYKFLHTDIIDEQAAN